jgi:hypothetical protein
MGEWLTLRHTVTGGRTRIPDDQGVLAAHVARGWVQDDDQDAPPTSPAVPAGVEWVEMVHPESGGVQLVPAHPDAVAGQAAAGWVPSEAAPVEVVQESVPVPPAGEDEGAAPVAAKQSKGAGK